MRAEVGELGGQRVEFGGAIHLVGVAKARIQHDRLELAVVQGGANDGQHRPQPGAGGHGIQRPGVARPEMAAAQRAVDVDGAADGDGAAEQPAERAVRIAPDVELEQVVVLGLDRGTGHREVALDPPAVGATHTQGRVLAGREHERLAVAVDEIDVQAQRVHLGGELRDLDDTGDQPALRVHDVVVAVDQAQFDVAVHPCAARQHQPLRALRRRQRAFGVRPELDAARHDRALAAAALAALARIADRHLVATQHLEQVLVVVCGQLQSVGRNRDRRHRSGRVREVTRYCVKFARHAPHRRFARQ
ncbi:hypothetical protein GALL_353700 [mine drainage metagenome]|uniref:Uncharacterized protein n=1 Tax=mine drainage metagenome TaxID=410659 RepID=A0A1J5QHU7_9ZZZZ